MSHRFYYTKSQQYDHRDTGSVYAGGFVFPESYCDTARSVLGPQYSLLPEVLLTQVFVAMLGANMHFF